MIPRLLLDTCIVSAPLARVPDPGITRRLERYAFECAIAAPVWHELVYGCRRLPRGRRRAALEVYLKEVVGPCFPILAYDEAAAVWHGVERARLERLGAPVPHVDGQIAGIAHSNGLILVTTNTRHFQRFHGLQLEDWSRPKAKGR